MEVIQWLAGLFVDGFFNWANQAKVDLLALRLGMLTGIGIAVVSFFFPNEQPLFALGPYATQFSLDNPVGVQFTIL